MNNNFPSIRIESLQDYIENINCDSRNGHYSDVYGCPWFRGQSDANKAPIPCVLRKKNDSFEGEYDEFNLTRTFRERSAVLSDTPERGEIDKWLFIMQHHGLPTRLLDWTESSLIALFFAVHENKDTDRAVWMIHPLELNNYSLGGNFFPNTWALNNSACVNFHAAFGIPSHTYRVNDKKIVISESNLPIAVPASYCDIRMFSQKSCFTIHGSDKRDFEDIFIEHDLVKKGYFIKYIIPHKKSQEIFNSLNTLGITYSSVYPDLDGLARELKYRFFKKSSNN